MLMESFRPKAAVPVNAEGAQILDMQPNYIKTMESQELARVFRTQYYLGKRAGTFI